MLVYILIFTFILGGRGAPTFSKVDLNDRHDTCVWTSGRRYDGGNKWIWGATGNPIHYTNWRAGQPDNQQKVENCLELTHLVDSGQIKWSDVPCDYKARYFICEYNNNTLDF
ncbi:unnamed protein product [Callosobruchus maculatus]|uniref:C-type lectin domain-containing protein n=1 Tax=Callosobruchus maculatus TaxID=64391 RepID=A0A653CB79_CALMS|nr:unnamed protein product [Callosobruchus maculatus]